MAITLNAQKTSKRQEPSIEYCEKGKTVKIPAGHFVCTFEGLNPDKCPLSSSEKGNRILASTPGRYGVSLGAVDKYRLTISLLAMYYPAS